MLVKIKLFLCALLAVFYLTPMLVSAADPCDIDGDGTITTQESIKCGADQSAGVPQDANAEDRVNKTVQNLIDVLSIAVGIAAVIMLIVGGFRYITSSGNQETVKAAKNTVTYALIGLVIVGLAQLIVNFVLNKTTQP